jgi:putative serine protease PepD
LFEYEPASVSDRLAARRDRKGPRPSLGGGAAPGIGFAIPSSLVTKIARQIIRYGHVVDSDRAYFGVDLGTGATGGAVVVSVEPSSPASRAGIATGDTIETIDGRAINGAASVATASANLKPGRTVTVEVANPNGKHRTLKIRLGQYPSSAAPSG